MTTEAWFSARLVIERLFPTDPEADKLFEERIILLRASNEEDAEKKAKHIGTKSEAYQNQYGEEVTWRFVEVLDVVQILDDDIEPGTEVYYHLINEEALASVRKSLEPGALG